MPHAPAIAGTGDPIPVGARVLRLTHAGAGTPQGARLPAPPAPGTENPAPGTEHPAPGTENPARSAEPAAPAPEADTPGDRPAPAPGHDG